MKIVNAEWELRNLGKRTVELTLEKADLLLEPRVIYDNIKKTETQLQSEYTVVKVPAGNPQIGMELQQNGFWHIEMQLHLKAALADVISAIKKYDNLFEDASAQVISSEDDITYVQNEIRKGIFTTDRIALDPYFGVEIANQRYANWVEDEINRGSILSYTIINKQKVGFSLRRNNQGLLGGVFTQYQKDNYGAECQIAGWRNLIHQGLETFYTAVSSNNLKILHLHEAFGYRVKSLSDVFVKHNHQS